MSLPAKTIVKPGLKLAAKPGAAAIKPATAKTEPTHMFVTRRVYKDGALVDLETEVEDIQVTKFEGQTATASLAYKQPITFGEREYGSVSVFLSVPTYVEQIDDAYDFLHGKLIEKLDASLAAMAERMPAGGAGTGEETVEGAEAGAAGEGSQITDDSVRKMKRDEIEELIKENGLEEHIDLSKFPKTAKGLTALQEALISLAEEAQKAAAAAAAAGGEAEAEVEADPADGVNEYSQETLDAADEAELKQLWESWEMGDFPKGPPAVRKKLAIAKILETQALASA